MNFTDVSQEINMPVKREGVIKGITSQNGEPSNHPLLPGNEARIKVIE